MAFTKQTTIVWDKSGKLDGGASDPSYAAYNAEDMAKSEEMRQAGKMSYAGKRTMDGNTFTATRTFIDEAAAQEWIDFNRAMSEKYNKPIISATISDI